MNQDNATLRAAGIDSDAGLDNALNHDLAQALGERADIMAATQATVEAMLNPSEPGGLSTAERAALASRIARLNAEPELADYYHDFQPQTDSCTAQLADPTVANTKPRLAALTRHVDLVTISPKDATRDDIKALQTAGVTEADIVRLSEIIAFVNYQCRVVAGLKLLQGETP